MAKRLSYLAFSVAAALFFCICGSTLSAKATETAAAKNFTPPVNFHQVSKKIFRSGQPETGEFVSLHQTKGVRSVLNLRQYHSDRYKIYLANRQTVNAIALYEIPINTSRISEKDICQILTVIRDAPKPLLIHCWHGSDRTGCAVAAYRIVFENWSVEAAIAELMKPEYGHHKLFYTNIPALLRKANWKKIKAAILISR